MQCMCCYNSIMLLVMFISGIHVKYLLLGISCVIVKCYFITEVIRSIYSTSSGSIHKMTSLVRRYHSDLKFKRSVKNALVITGLGLVCIISVALHLILRLLTVTLLYSL